MGLKRLQTRMILFILLPTILFFGATGAFTSITTKNLVTKEAENKLETNGALLASDLKRELDSPLISIRTLAQTFEGMLNNREVLERKDANIMMQQLLVNNERIVSAWMYWEKDQFDGKDIEFANTEGHDYTGQFIPVLTRENASTFTVEPLHDYDKPGDLGDNIKTVLSSGQSMIFEPYEYDFNGETVLVTSLAFPIKVGGKTVGMTGIDLSLESLNATINEFSFYDTGVVGLASNSGFVIAHQHSQLNGQNYFDSGTMDKAEDNDRVRNAMKIGEAATVEGYSTALETNVYRLFLPIQIMGIETPWSALLAVPVEEVTAEAKAITMKIIMISIFVTLLLTVIILLVTRGITNVLSKAVGRGEKIAEGDFTSSVSEKELQRADELGDLTRIFVTISNNMGGLIGKVKESAHMVAESANSVDIGTRESTIAANEVTSSIEKVAQSAEIQMQSAGESAKAMDDMAEGVQAVAQAATTVSDTTNMMLNQANNGQQVVQDAVQQMNDIHKGTADTKSAIDQLAVGADEIQSIVTAITSISEQTNLLALNAAIEAARAGEYGKGFAVVANEVRKLADETNISAADIQKLVIAIQAHTVKAAQSMDGNAQDVSKGIEHMEQVTKSFEQIIHSVEQIVKEAIELSAVSEEMSAGSEEIAASAEEMASSAELSYEQTHQVAAASEQQLASMEEIARSSETLKSLAADLNYELQQFKV